MSELETDTATNGHLSHLEFLRARHDELAQERTLELEIPGYQGRLVVRYGPIPWATVARTARTLADDKVKPEVVAAGNSDALIAACREVLFRDESGELVSVGPEGPYRFDQALADLLGAGTESARALVLWLFGGDDAAKLRIGQQAGELLTWLEGVGQETQETFAGE